MQPLDSDHGDIEVKQIFGLDHMNLGPLSLTVSRNYIGGTASTSDERLTLFKESRKFLLSTASDEAITEERASQIENLYFKVARFLPTYLMVPEADIRTHAVIYPANELVDNIHIALGRRNQVLPKIYLRDDGFGKDSTLRFVRTLSHELVHAYTFAGRLPGMSPMYEEELAYALGACAGLALLGTDEIARSYFRLDKDSLAMEPEDFVERTMVAQGRVRAQFERFQSLNSTENNIPALRAYCLYKQEQIHRFVRLSAH